MDNIKNKFHQISLLLYNTCVVCKYLISIILYLKEIKEDNEGTVSRKIALYRTFLQCGVRTWEQVIKALEICDHGEIAKQLKIQLLEYFSKVINVRS